MVGGAKVINKPEGCTSLVVTFPNRRLARLHTHATKVLWEGTGLYEVYSTVGETTRRRMRSHDGNTVGVPAPSDKYGYILRVIYP